MLLHCIDISRTINLTAITTSTTQKSMDQLRIGIAVLGIIIYLAGFIGNFLSFLLFVQKELRQVSTGLTFLLLNIFSTVHLLSLIVEFLDSIFQVQIFPSDVLRCQFTLWLQNASRTVCAFLTVTVSIDRFLRSEFPMASRAWCTPKNVLKLFIGYCLFSSAFYAFFFHPSNLFDTDGQCSFSRDESFRLFALNIMPPIRFVLTCLLPTIIMLVCGGRMLFNIRRSRKRITHMSATMPNGIATIALPASGVNPTKEGNRRSTTSMDNMLLWMVLVNVIAFIITQIPFSAYTLYYGYQNSSDYKSYSLTRAFLLMWGSVYFGIGFYLFSVTSPQFRSKFNAKMKNLCCCDRCRS